KRIVFFSGVGGFSSLARISALARSLDSGEYDVVICGDARAIAGFERESRTLIPISCLSPDRVNGVTERGAPLFDMETIEKHIWEDLRIIRRTVPDVVVGDMRQSLTVSCKLAGLPHVNVINAQWSPYARASFELPVQQAGGAFGFEPIARMIASAAAPLAFACHVLPLNLVRSKYGLPPADWNMKHSYSAGDFVVYPDIENIVPARGLPDNHLYLGAVLENSDARLPDWWDEVPADRPIVHLNLGDLGERRLQQIALDTLGRMPLSVICSTTPFGRVPNPPANAYMADYLPGVGAAKRSQLVICNGGNFAAQHALAGSAPVLGVISNMDQRVFTKALKSRGAAEFIEGRQANQPALERMVYQMLQRQSYRMAAERLSVLYESAAASLKFKALIRRAAGDAVTDTVTARGAL
ncbi:MAG TPA: hypothetical protein VEZ90_08825, partial [Blastocatellia bacterium]|nr:hypothetical protein [Blastocatellia bacterium]